MIKELIRKNIANLKPYTSARDLYSEGILLDANESAFGATSSTFKKKNLNRYPDPHQNQIRSLLGEYLNIDKQNLFFGVGSDEIIDLLIRAFCEPQQDEICIPAPTYGMYEIAAEINNVKLVAPLLNQDFQIDFDELEKSITKRTKIIFLCSPNNPVGNLLKKEDIYSVCKKYNCLVVVDEAYIEFAEHGSVAKDVECFANLVVLRTMSKAWGLAGIRLGYCIANAEVINVLFKIKAPYNISTPARLLFLEAMGARAKRDRYVAYVAIERVHLYQLLLKLPKVERIFYSNANFILIKCSDPKRVQKEMAERGVIIRDRSTLPLLEGCLRITIGTKKENTIMLKNLKELL